MPKKPAQNKSIVKARASRALVNPPAKLVKIKPVSEARYKKGSTFANEQGDVLRNAELISRALLSARLGLQFDGDRDLYSSFGYPLNPTFIEYKAHFDRQGVANRILEKFADDTWGNPPAIVDGSSSTDVEVDQTPFVKGFSELARRLALWQVFRQADIMCGIGRYAIIFLGAPADPDQQSQGFLAPAADSGLFYMAAYDEKQALISKWVTNTSDPRFTMPEVYSVIFNSYNDGAPLPAGGSAVHFSRVLHVSENRYGSRVYGRPRMQTILNRLYDLEKMTGGAAEAVWLTLWKGLILTGKEGAQLPDPESTEAKYLEQQLSMWSHRLQRTLVFDNVDVKDMGVDEIKVKDTFDILIDDLCASVNIPRRILMGSERGELASSQDEREWNAVIRHRQKYFAEPEVLNPFIDWCIVHKVLPPPTSGKVTFKWNPVYELNEKEMAERAELIAKGASELTGGMGDEAVDIDEWRAINKLPPQKRAVTPEDQASAEAIAAEEEALSTEVGVGGRNG